ncbi:MAG: phosphate--nucleotide phosphotransferase [Micrococcales bacterium 73-13]|nr:MAG: phosphate--nucleotide phosphotransferase [Micrococcales bacterium 73-13]
MSALEPVGPGFRLADVDPDATPGIDRAHAERELTDSADELSDLQERLYADAKVGGTRSVLLVLQGIDTAGKGGIIRHVVGLVDPQGVRITAFKAPTPQERAHDFLWRIRRALPEPGLIGVFDRSHYEDVLIHRVRGLSPLEVVEQRYGIIRDFEAGLVAGGTLVRKVMLQISRDEQRKRLQDRLDRPDKHWKFNPGDIDERLLWDDYQAAYQIALERTSTPDAPWYVVPADAKWYARWAVHRILLDALREIDLQWPPADFDVEHEKARLAAS